MIVTHASELTVWQEDRCFSLC